jgi:SAM-dependent methyltransferase
MAELATTTTTCCGTKAQSTCCEPEHRTECCGEQHVDGCACATDTTATTSAESLRETVREKYATAARQAGVASGWCCEAGFDPADTGAHTFGAALYGEEGAHAPEEAVKASLGCGVPTAVADLHDGETVLDLGSGAGADVFISARRVGPTGWAIGIDMTDEMLDLARRNAAAVGLENVEFRKGYLEQLPLEDDSVDVVISNCVINLAGDKPKVLAEAARVLNLSPAAGSPSPM